MNFNIGGPSNFSSSSSSSDEEEKQLLANLEAVDAEQEVILAQHADATDEYIKIEELTTIKSLKRFCRAVVGEFTGRSGSPTIILEAVADYDLWILYACFGLPDKRDVDASIEDHMKTPTPKVEMMFDENTIFQQFLTRHREIRDQTLTLHSENRSFVG
ncbi:hypothetical protein Ddye_026360 [Dipteronia dyeriana]|uniref:Uncharacterized protein n=1 Tax=Dipteronia dyeriana TaxID=168575 RepID=A0AAD9WQG8_9ROSI|nr:hypothetical protein Ddye_026360 [Dipteronia dyeriana]